MSAVPDGAFKCSLGEWIFNDRTVKWSHVRYQIRKLFVRIYLGCSISALYQTNTLKMTLVAAAHLYVFFIS